MNNMIKKSNGYWILIIGFILIILAIYMFINSITIKPYFSGNKNLTNQNGQNPSSIVNVTGIIKSKKYDVISADVKIILLDSNKEKVLATFDEHYHRSSELSLNYEYQYTTTKGHIGDVRFEISNVKADNTEDIFISIILLFTGFCTIPIYITFMKLYSKYIEYLEFLEEKNQFID